MTLAGPGTFTFNSIALYGDASLWGGAFGGEPVTIVGLLNGAVVDSFTTPSLDSLARGAFTTFNFDWSNINEVTFSTNNLENLLLTDVTVDAAATPLPAALPLFATGLGGLGLLGWRRKRKAQAAA